MKLKLDLKGLLGKKKGSAPQVDGIVVDGEKSAGAQSAKQVLVWIKSNALVVTLAVVSIGALVSAYLFSSDFAAENKKRAQEMAQQLDDLRALERSSVTITIPGNDPIQFSGVVSRKMVEEVRTRMTSGDEKPENVMALAVAHNSRGRAPAMSLLVPVKDPKVQQVHFEMFDALKKQYDALLSDCRATLPPSEDDVRAELRRTKARFLQMNQIGQTSAPAKQGDGQSSPQPAGQATAGDGKGKAALDGALQAQLRSELQARRLGEYSKAAAEGGLYCSAEALGFDPNPARKATPEARLLELWRRQMKFWVAEDVVQACMAVNKARSIPDAPIKRIVGINFVTLAGEGEDDQGGSLSDSATPPAEQPLEGAPEGEVSSADALSGPPIDLQMPVTRNYEKSLSGWSTNQLFDVHTAVVRCVVETSKIPALINALAKRNFVVVTNVRVAPVDPFAAIADGYYYGAKEPVSLVTLTIDSAWLRQWTGPLMPEPVRKQLGTSGTVQGGDPAANGGAAVDGGAG